MLHDHSYASEPQFSATDPHVHSTLRRMSASAYTMTSLLRLESGVQRQVVSLLTSLTSRYADVPDKHCDIGRMLQFLAADVVGALAFGHEDGFDMVNDDKDDKGWLDAVQGTNEVGFILGSWHTWGPRLWNLLGIIGTPPKAITQLFQVSKPRLWGESDSRERCFADRPALNLDYVCRWLKATVPNVGKHSELSRAKATTFLKKET